jgi:hypothetical protein
MLYKAWMKQDLIILLNEEISKAMHARNESIKGQDLLMKLAWSKVIEILETVITKIQVNG